MEIVPPQYCRSRQRNNVREASSRCVQHGTRRRAVCAAHSLRVGPLAGRRPVAASSPAGREGGPRTPAEALAATVEAETAPVAGPTEAGRGSPRGAEGDRSVAAAHLRLRRRLPAGDALEVSRPAAATVDAAVRRARPSRVLRLDGLPRRRGGRGRGGCSGRLWNHAARYARHEHLRATSHGSRRRADGGRPGSPAAGSSRDIGRGGGSTPLLDRLGRRTPKAVRLAVCLRMYGRPHQLLHERPNDVRRRATDDRRGRPGRGHVRRAPRKRPDRRPDAWC